LALTRKPFDNDNNNNSSSGDNTNDDDDSKTKAQTTSSILFHSHLRGIDTATSAAAQAMLHNAGSTCGAPARREQAIWREKQGLSGPTSENTHTTRQFLSTHRDNTSLNSFQKEVGRYFIFSIFF
jgi:hypothetical protein